MKDNRRQDMTTQLECLIDAAEALAEKYDSDGRQHIKTDVMNAFYAGAKWQSENIEQEPVCYMQENQPYVYVSETKNEGSGYTIPLYTSPPNAKAIETAALMKAVKALEANEQFYARDTIQSLITREDE